MDERYMLIYTKCLDKAEDMETLARPYVSYEKCKHDFDEMVREKVNGWLGNGLLHGSLDISGNRALIKDEGIRIVIAIRWMHVNDNGEWTVEIEESSKE